MSEPVSFARACADYFWREPHGSKVEIGELKDLTPKDRAQLAAGLVNEGYEIRETVAAAA